MKNNKLKNNCLVLRYVFKFCPWLVFYTVLNVITTVIKNIIEVVLISKAIKLVSTVTSFKEIFSGLIIYILIIALCMIYNVIYDDYIVIKNQLVYQKNMQKYLYEKVKDIDIALYDDPVFYDRFSRTSRDSIWRGYRTFNSIKNFIIYLATTIALGTYIVISDPTLILIILFSNIINAILLNKVNVIQYEYFKSSEIEGRYMRYVNRLFYRQENAAEIKTTNLSNLLIEKYKEVTNSLNKKKMDTNKKIIIPNILIPFVSNILCKMGSYIILMLRLANGKVEIATFTALITAITKFQNQISSLTSLVTNLNNNALYVEDFIWILNYKGKVEAKKESINLDFNQLKLDNIFFSYPNTTTSVLKGIDITASKGQKIAIVGVNGAGKTTLMKLLLKFYDLTGGNIYLNEHSYNDLDSSQIRNEYSIVFQDFKLYAVTIAENVLMRRLKTKEDEEIVWSALRSVGLEEKIKQMPQGINTEVTREFDRDGASFSGGERQRLAIARVFASNKDIYILDEPTSSLDPIAEERINKLIIENAKEKTMFIIAHRLSTVVDADMIYLIDNGKIKESGTHQELMQMNGQYALMFNTQKHLYEEE